MNDLLGWGGGAETAGKGAGGVWAEPLQVAVRLMGDTAKIPHPSRAVPGQAESPALMQHILPIVHQAELAGLEHPCFTSALLSAMVTCPQDNLANAREMTRSVL